MRIHWRLILHHSNASGQVNKEVFRPKLNFPCIVQKHENLVSRFLEIHLGKSLLEEAGERFGRD